MHNITRNGRQKCGSASAYSCFLSFFFTFYEFVMSMTVWLLHDGKNEMRQIPIDNYQTSKNFQINGKWFSLILITSLSSYVRNYSQNELCQRFVDIKFLMLRMQQWICCCLFSSCICVCTTQCVGMYVFDQIVSCRPILICRKWKFEIHTHTLEIGSLSKKERKIAQLSGHRFLSYSISPSNIGNNTIIGIRNQKLYSSRIAWAQRAYWILNENTDS